MSAPTRSRPGAPMDARIAERRARIAHDRRRRRRRVLGSLAGLGLLLAAGGAVLASPLFTIEAITVAGAPPGREDEVRDALGIDPGDNLAWADTASAAEALAGLSWVAEARVGRTLPATVDVNVVPRRPAAVVRLEDSAWTVDAEGVVLSGGVGDEDAPQIDAPNSALPGPGVALSDAAVANALAFHRALPDDVADRVDRYDAPSERGLRLRIATASGVAVWVRVGTAEEVERKAAVIDALLEQTAQRGAGERGVAELDVRVPSNPVLVPADPGAG